MNDCSTPYEQLFRSFANGIEKWFIRLVCVLVLVVVCAQLLLSIPNFRDVISPVAQIEGTPYEGG